MNKNNVARINTGELALPPGVKRPQKKTAVSLTQPVLSDFVWICHNLPEDEQRQFMALSGATVFDPDQAALNCAGNPGVKWVLVETESGKPLAVGGYTPLRSGVWQSFMLVPEASWESHGREITRQVLKVIKEMKKQGHRLQTLVLQDRAKARAWYARIGLQNEGTLRHYGANGENVEMYSIVQEQENV